MSDQARIWLLFVDFKQIPRRRKANDATPQDPWKFVKLPVNTFTRSEWPECELAPSASFSVGEEQSNSTVTWLGWSPPGLAKHKRSVLAVLTSNHLLSLWAANEDLGNLESWKRVCIINDAFEIAFRQERFQSKIENIQDQRLRRARSAAWAPSLNVREGDIRNEYFETGGVQGDGESVTTVSGNQISTDCTMQESTLSELLPTQYQLLAVANDCGGIYILLLSSPFLNNSDEWGVEMLDIVVLPSQDEMILDVQQDVPEDGLVSLDNTRELDPANKVRQESSTSRPSLLALVLEKKTFFEDVLWSNWGEGTLRCEKRSVLTAKLNGIQSHLVLSIDCSQAAPRCSFLILSSRKRDRFERAQRSMLWLSAVCLLICGIDMADAHSPPKIMVSSLMSIKCASVLAHGTIMSSNI